MRILILFAFLGLFFRTLSPAFIVNKSTSKITVQDGATFIVESIINNFRGTLIRETGGEILGTDINFCDGLFEDEGRRVKLTGKLDLEDSNEILLAGSEKFKGKREKIRQKIKASGENNRIEGILQVDQDVELQDTNSSFTFAVSGRVPKNIKLNGGKIFLEEDLHFVDDMFFDGSGTVELNRRNLHLGSTEMTTNAVLYFDSAQDIELHANFHLASQWTFSNTSVIEGNGNILYLDSGGEIIIERGSSLLLKNVMIRGVKNNNIRCLDENSVLSAQGATLVLESNYSFTMGSLQVCGDLKLSGTNTFAYQSAQTSTVNSYARLILDRGLTFSFDPIYTNSFSSSDWEGARNFLAFEDYTSELVLRGATLHATTTSMKLKRGMLRVKERSYISSELENGFRGEQGVVLGDEASIEDMKCEISESALLSVSSGVLSYKNVCDGSFVMNNEFSKLSIGSGSKLKLYQTMDIGDGLVSFCSGSKLARASGKKLIGAVNILGVVGYESC